MTSAIIFLIFIVIFILFFFWALLKIGGIMNRNLKKKLVKTIAEGVRKENDRNDE
ncbi:MAG: hypothetical protein GX640_11650 [Fibrobacter sp.]|nr:hypothetical protein [Fibrobacter sp.]